MNKLLIISVLAMLIACEPALEDPYENFLIPEGKHAGLWKMQSLQSKTLNFSVIFDHSAIYQAKTTENQHDIHKLLGFSDCNSTHHQNSARFGWRWLDGKLEIHAYAYIKGARISQYIGDIELNQPVDCELLITDDHYVFYLEGHDPLRIKREAPCSKGLYYMLFPYFGGNEVAPHDILIKILTKY